MQTPQPNNPASTRVLTIVLAFSIIGGLQLYFSGVSVHSAFQAALWRNVSDSDAAPPARDALPVGMVSTHVINLDASIDRWNDMLALAKAVRLPVERFPAVDVRPLTRKDMSKMLPIYNRLLRRLYSKKEHGAVGCFLSHRNVLQHLHESTPTTVDQDSAHLILEDDAMFKPDFRERWAEAWSDIQSLKGDWDIVMLGIFKHALIPLSNHTILRISDGVPFRNLGTHGYVVRHGSLSRLLEELEMMHRPIDIQYTRAGIAGRIKWFALAQDIIWQSTNLGFTVSTIRGGSGRSIILPSSPLSSPHSALPRPSQDGTGILEIRDQQGEEALRLYENSTIRGGNLKK
jgi:glycosyl transferase family 25